MNASLRNALNQYKRVGVGASVEDATPHRLIQMLMEGALARIAAAQGHMGRGEVGPKGENVSLAISIIGGLQGCLDLERGGEVAANLDGLYDYMARRLLEGNAENDPAKLSEVHHLLAEVKAGWDAIPPELHEPRKGPQPVP
jgi:flagellar protein FliS